MKKQTTILLSALILGGFLAPTGTNNVQASVIDTEVVQRDDKNVRSTNNQILRPNSFKIIEKIDLDQLNTETSIIVSTHTKNTDNVLDDVYLNLSEAQIKELKQKQETNFEVPNLDIKMDWGGSLHYEGLESDSDMKLKYDQTSKTFQILDSTNKPEKSLTYKLVNGDANVHYIFADTGKEFITGIHEDVFQQDRELFVIEPTYWFTDNGPIGYFDAMDIDFDNLDNSDHALNPLQPNFHEDDIRQEFKIDDINKNNAEYTVKLVRAKPVTLNFKVYLDDKVYFEKTVTGDVNSVIPRQTDEKLPSSKEAILNPNKTKAAHSYQYFPQLGQTIQTGKALHRTLFDRGLSEFRTNDFLNRSLHFLVSDNTHDGELLVDPEKTGQILDMEIHYDSINSDTSSGTSNGNNENSNNKPQTPNPDKPSTEKPSTSKPQTSNPEIKPETFDGFVATMDKNASLYSFNGKQMDKLNDKALGTHSDWVSNSIVKVNGEKYYQVATNEWVKAAEIFRYENEEGVVDTLDNEVTMLKQCSNKLVANRGLAAKTSWKYNRIAYFGKDEEKQYRVATNEYVTAKDTNKK